jgi:hypothetical protein
MAGRWTALTNLFLDENGYGEINFDTNQPSLYLGGTVTWTTPYRPSDFTNEVWSVA